MLVKCNLLLNCADSVPLSWVFVHLVNHQLLLYRIWKRLSTWPAACQAEFFPSAFYRSITAYKSAYPNHKIQHKHTSS